MARRSFSFNYDDLGRLTSSAPTLNTVAKATDNYGYDALRHRRLRPERSTLLDERDVHEFTELRLRAHRRHHL